MQDKNSAGSFFLFWLCCGWNSTTVQFLVIVMSSKWSLTLLDSWVGPQVGWWWPVPIPATHVGTWNPCRSLHLVNCCEVCLKYFYQKLVSGQPLSAVEVTQSHGLTEGKTRVWIIGLNTIKGISPDRGENLREKSKVFPLPVSPYYTTLNCAQTHYLVHTDPMLHRPLTDSGSMYASYFTFMVIPEVKVEWSSNLRVEQSSDLEVGWNLEQWKCEMGHPLTASMQWSLCRQSIAQSFEATAN